MFCFCFSTYHVHKLCKREVGYTHPGQLHFRKTDRPGNSDCNWPHWNWVRWGEKIHFLDVSLLAWNFVTFWNMTLFGVFKCKPETKKMFNSLNMWDIKSFNGLVIFLWHLLIISHLIFPCRKNFRLWDSFAKKSRLLEAENCWKQKNTRLPQSNCMFPTSCFLNNCVQWLI